MISRKLREARKFEEWKEKDIAPEERPLFHLSPRTGWMNDPNGFSVYNGEYHMFYQYHPYSTIWGPLHWGHAVSSDLLHWKYLPAALAPDHSYDRDGCFSGSAITLPDGRQLLMYTGIQKLMPDEPDSKSYQVQCLAVGDGIDYEKYADNPVIGSDDLPEGADPLDFRDPKMWQEADGTYRCILGSRPEDKSGQLLIYSSEDAFNWKFERILVRNENRFGKMWECPDFFFLDGKAVLLVSPQDMFPQGFEYHNGNGTVCFFGHLDENGFFVEEHDQAIDYGIDFYAPQTILTPDGRRVMIGWMQNWDTCTIRTPEYKWFGQMSLPRELSIRNGRLYQQPLRELEAMRTDPAVFQDVLLNDSDVVTLPGVEGRTLDLELELRAEDPEALYRKFEMHFARSGEGLHTSLSYLPRESVLKIDRKFSGSRRAIIHQRRAKVAFRDGKLKLRIILDRFSAEIFINDGEQVMTCTVFTDLTAEGISFFADGKVRMDLTKYALN